MVSVYSEYTRASLVHFHFLCIQFVVSSMYSEVFSVNNKNTQVSRVRLSLYIVVPVHCPFFSK